MDVERINKVNEKLQLTDGEYSLYLAVIELKEAIRALKDKL